MPADIFVAREFRLSGIRSSIFRGRQESRIVPLFRKTEHILVSVKTGLGCARARHHQPFKPEPPFKREDAAATAERYRKVPLVGGDLLQVHEYNVVDGCGTLENLSQVLLIASMTAGQVVLGFLRVAVGRVITVMRSHMPEAMENLQCFRVIYNIHTFADILFRRTVMMLEERDVAIAYDRRRPALFHLIAYGRKRTQIVGFRTLEKFAAGILAGGHAGGIELLQ